MKKFLFITLMICTFTGIYAQDVYKEVKRLSLETAANTKKTNFERSLALFKTDALEYMAVKSGELMRDSSMMILNTQAYGLYEFCFYYMAATDKARSKAAKENVKKVFKEISLTTPRFNDEETDISHAYVNVKNKTNITPFCLDTDWVIAVQKLKDKGYYF